MPIILDDLVNDIQTQNNSVKIFSPKFFDEKLTGKGGTSTVGVLSANAHPINTPTNVSTDTSHWLINEKKSIHNGNTTFYKIPINPINPKTAEHIKSIDTPDLNDLTLVAENQKLNAKLYYNMKVTAISIEETTISNYYTGQSSVSRKVIPTYQITFYSIVNNNMSAPCSNNDLSTRLDIKRYNTAIAKYTSNPIDDWNKLWEPTLNNNGHKTYTKNFIDFIAKFDTYDSVAKSSEDWQVNIDAITDKVFANLNDGCFINVNNKALGLSSTGLNVITTFVKYLMNYNIQLELYKNIYQAINTHFSVNTKDICKHNLNLLLSNTLNNLNTNKSNLITFHAPANMTVPTSVTKLSAQQIKAVKCEDPLILVQAGAGTGKSTLILSRIEYLIAAGVNPSDITVLSFTNAAADNITAKNPEINSMTIARMIHEIYTNNFTGHELSSLDTILNSLEIYYPKFKRTSQTEYITEFERLIKSMIKSEANCFTEMNNFIEDNYDAVINLLDTISQTSLELEIIICYQKIDSLSEPASVQSKFLIIDEVQDNSVFEFVYTIKYIDKHQQSMFIVGDCSQTLYEFRASNPRALNILEGSGTFEAFQLTTNYRSNQEILDMANIMLQNIEANQYAKIQLKANSRAKVTEQSFLEKVHFNYHRLNKTGDLHDQLPSIFARQLRKYINDCLARKEQIAILAYTRRDIARIKEILTVQYPNANIVSLVPKKMFNSTVISNFIKNYWNNIKFAPSISIMNLITQEIMLKLSYLTYNAQAAAPMVRDMLNRWRNENQTIIQVWVNQFLNNQMSHDALLDNIKRNLLQFEISSNAIKQALLSAQNQQNKQSDNIENANFLLSTIHSAKGLEFDNVIVLYKNKNSMPEEEKRMYYVALTRAMKSEYILAYDTMVSPQIEADYLTVLKALHAKSPAPNSPFNTTTNNKIKI